MLPFNKRNSCLDCFKGIACLSVVFLHVKLPFEILDGILQSAVRFAVPLFFMISGYYCYYNDNEILIKKLPKKIKHIGIVAITSLFYWVLMQCAICMFGAEHNDLKETLLRMITPDALFKFIVLNADPAINILWFIFALLYIYIFMYIFARLNKVNVLLWLTPLLLIMHFIVGNVSYALGVQFETALYRNCWLMGIPLFMLGYFINKSNLHKIISHDLARNCIFVGLILSVFEWILIGGRQQMYVGSVVVAMSMIIYSQHNSEKVCVEALKKIGAKYSLVIYIIHISVGIILDKFLKICHINRNLIYLSLKPIIVIVISLFFAIIIVKLNDLLKEMKNNENRKS